MKPHKYAELIKAWADGAEIEMYFPNQEVWHFLAQPRWLDEYQYRIKPEPKPDVVRYTNIIQRGEFDVYINKCLVNNLKLTWDGNTGELKKAEVL